MSEQTGNGGTLHGAEPFVRVTGSSSTDLPRVQDVGWSTGSLGEAFRTQPPAATLGQAISLHVRAAERGSAGARLVGREVTTRELYPAPAEAGSRLFADAVRLIDEALRYVDEALAEQQAGEILAADDAMMRVRALLPELFACRALGDGFAMVVGALIIGFQRHAPDPMMRDEIRAVRAALTKLQGEPYMIEEAASNAVDALEAAGLLVRLAGLDRLVEEPGAESVP